MPDLIIHLDALGLRRGGIIALTRGSVALEPRILQAGDGITITNPSGAAGDPTIAVDADAVLAALAAASDDAAGKIEIAVQSEMEAASDTTRAVVPARVQYHPGVAKFWAFVAGGALTASYNVTSITDDGAGTMTVTIGTDFSSSNWSCVATGEHNADRFLRVNARAAGSVTLVSYDVSAAGLANSNYNVVGFGDQ